MSQLTKDGKLEAAKIIDDIAAKRRGCSGAALLTEAAAELRESAQAADQPDLCGAISELATAVDHGTKVMRDLTNALNRATAYRR